ncbi:hypothetical protein [Halomarina pelagica]|uniref:hypothetical protein n=1 Tax=Halomarina pelagica TaxID=2961599 RepID=UPI0020C316E7|nr:hypothetical protein [Halomarina sp. BND7]
MQRRAAAVLFVFFLVIGASAYSVITVAQEPEIEVKGQAYQPGNNFTIDGQEYNLSEVSLEEASSSGGGHGGGGGGEPTWSGTLVYTKNDALQSETLENNTTVQFNNSSYLVTIGMAPDPATAPTSAGNETGGNATSGNATNGTNASAGGNTTAGATNNTTAGNATGGNATSGNATNGTNASAASGAQAGNATNATNGTGGNNTSAMPNTLVFTQQRNVSAILANDTAVANETVETGGQTYVRYLDNNTLVPLQEYLSPAPQQTFQPGDRFPYNNTTVTLKNITESGATLVWRGDVVVSTDIAEGENVTLANNETYVVHFPSDNPNNKTVVLSQERKAYQQEVAQQEFFHERISGLWAVSIISWLSAFLLLGLAYMPHRG